MTNILKNWFKILILVVSIAFLYFFYLIYGAVKEISNNGRYQPFGKSNDLVIDTRTGYVTDSNY